MHSSTKVVLQDGYLTTAMARGHTWHADLPEEGDNAFATPEEMMLGALGSCMTQTAKLYAVRKGWQIDRLEVTLDFARFRGTEYPAYEGDAMFVHEIQEQITIEGPLDAEQRARILEIMGKCPVRRLISNPVFFLQHEFKEEVAAE